MAIWCDRDLHFAVLLLVIIFFVNNFFNPASPASNLIRHPFIRVENFDFKQISDYPVSMIDNLQAESRCLLCNSLLLKIDLIDRFCVWIRYAGLFAGLLDRHPLLVDEADKFFSLVVRHLNVVVLFCHVLLGKWWVVLYKERLFRNY